MCAKQFNCFGAEVSGIVFTSGRVFVSMKVGCSWHTLVMLVLWARKSVESLFISSCELHHLETEERAKRGVVEDEPPLPFWYVSMIVWN